MRFSVPVLPNIGRGGRSSMFFAALLPAVSFRLAGVRPKMREFSQPFLVSSLCPAAGHPYMGIKYGDVDIAGSPHQFTVTAGNVDPNKCTAAWPELPGEATKMTSFYVTLRDQNENIVCQG